MSFTYDTTSKAITKTASTTDNDFAGFTLSNIITSRGLFLF